MVSGSPGAWGHDLYPARDAIDAGSARPAFAGLLYLVVSMQRTPPPLKHPGNFAVTRIAPFVLALALAVAFTPVLAAELTDAQLRAVVQQQSKQSRHVQIVDDGVPAS